MTSHIDGQFGPLRGNLADMKIQLNLSSPYDKFPEI